MNIIKMRIISLASLILILGAHDVSAQSLLSEVPDGIQNHSVDESLLNTISQALPEEGQRIEQNFLNQAYDPNIYLSDASQMAITFIDEGAGYRNSLGYFTYNTGAFDGLTFDDIDIDDSGIVSANELNNLSGVNADLIFPNASKTYGGGNLQMGDTYVLGGGTSTFNNDGTYAFEGGTVFEAETNVGFFLMANAWNDNGSVGTVDGWDGTAGDPYTYYSMDFLNPENDWDATIGTLDYDARHVALTFESTERDTLILGFEDLNRATGGSDDDFNDAVFIIRTNPEVAMAETKVEVYSAPAPQLGSSLVGIAFLLLAFIRKRKKLFTLPCSLKTLR